MNHWKRGTAVDCNAVEKRHLVTVFLNWEGPQTVTLQLIARNQEGLELGRDDCTIERIADGPGDMVTFHLENGMDYQTRVAQYELGLADAPTEATASPNQQAGD